MISLRLSKKLTVPGSEIRSETLLWQLIAKAVKKIPTASIQALVGKRAPFNKRPKTENSCLTESGNRTGVGRVGISLVDSLQNIFRSIN